MTTSIKSYKFAEFLLNPAKRKLFRGSAEIRLRDKDFDVLLFLIESVPEPCSPDEIIAAVWNGTVVENNSVEKAIANIRGGLGDDAKSPRFIKTIRAKGYLFIGDASEFEAGVSAESFAEAREKDSAEDLPDDSSQNVSRAQSRSVNRRTALLSLCVLVLTGLVGLFLWVGNGAWTSKTIIFADDFSSGELNPNRWKIKGKTVRVEDGIAKILNAETDNGGWLQSSLFSFEPGKAVTITCRIKVSPSQNLRDKSFFNGYFGLLPKTALLPQADANIYNHYKFGINYTNYDYESKYPNGDIDELKAEGFFLAKDNGSPNKKIDYRDGRIGKRIEPVWDKWFEQKIVYEPFSGKMSCFINEELKDVMNVGDLLKVMEENKLRLDIYPAGWWVNHSIEIDYIEITQ